MKKLVTSALLDCNCIIELDVPSVVELPQAGKEVEHYCHKACKVAISKLVKASGPYWVLDTDTKTEAPLEGQTSFIKEE
jgi:hypothetical protein